MTQYILTIVDTTGVQDYIFATNSLRQNAGASFLADCATDDWVYEVLDVVAANNHLQAELIYSGGGNAVLLFDSYERAKQFTRELTRRVLIHAPGLRIVVDHTEFDWETKAIGGKAGVLQCAFRILKERKQSSSPSYPVLGLGVTSRCVFSGLPAVDYDKDKRPVSAEADAKEKQEFRLDEERKVANETAYGRLITSFEFRGYAPARDFDKLGVSPNESSLIAIVHADGNSMGKRIEAIRDEHDTPDKNRDCLNALRDFSDSVKKASSTALQKTIDLLIANIKTTKRDGKDVYYISAEPGKDDLEGAVIFGEVDQKERSNRNEQFHLPFRPIVLGGDDTTFVCEGRLGLFLASYYLQEFTEQTLSDHKKAHCRAGVALVPLHFPFARAYKLAEDLCKSARSSINQWKDDNQLDKDGGVTAIDWHFAIGGMVREMKEVRRLEYTSNAGFDSDDRAGDLLMRPLRLDAHEKEWRSWPVFMNTVREFKTSETWRNRHNKVKALREALRKGEKAVTQFRRIYAAKKPLMLPKIHQSRSDMPEKGWQGIQCGYFDAIEAMDRLIELDTTLSLAPASNKQEAE